MNMEPKWFLFIIFYNGTFIIIKILTEFNTNLHVLLSHCVMAALIQLLLLSNDTSCLLLSSVCVLCVFFLSFALAYFIIGPWAVK